MKPDLASVSIVIALNLTVVAAALAGMGFIPALVILVIGLCAFCAWLLVGSPAPSLNDRVTGPYLLLIPLLVLLDACRYASGWVELLSGNLQSVFTNGFLLDDTAWFVIMVVSPVTLMLLGGYAMIRHHPLGGYMAWWTALFAICEGLFQFAVSLSVSLPFGFAQAAGLATALALLLTAVLVLKHLLSGKAKSSVPEAMPMSVRRRNLWSALFVALVAVYGVTLFREAGPLPVVVIVGSMAGGMLGWRLTTAKVPADPAWAVPLFLLLLALFYIHIGEEALTHFNRAIAILSGKDWSDHDFTMLIGLLGPVVWFWAAWSLWKRQAAGNFIFWFLIVGMILGEPTHLLVFPVVAMVKQGIGYAYFSGMYTALFPMVPAVLALAAIIKDRKAQPA